MGASGTLTNKLDRGLVSRIKTRPDGTLYIARPEHVTPAKRVKLPRVGTSYRHAKRNIDRAKGWPEATFAKQRALASPMFIPLNRSEKWVRAKSYAYAREISPSSEPVR